jgi:hypothetical protein
MISSGVKRPLLRLLPYSGPSHLSSKEELTRNNRLLARRWNYWLSGGNYRYGLDMKGFWLGDKLRVIEVSVIFF